MKLFGYELTRKKTIPPSLSSPDSRGQGWYRIWESFAGAWQSNVAVDLSSVLTYSPVFACCRLIATDIGKLRLRLVEQDEDGIWSEIESPAFSPFLRKPNHFQTRNEFVEQWMYSKLIHGNSYTLAQRDARGIVTAGYVLDPLRVRPLVAPDSAIFYQLSQDNLSGIEEAGIIVPASEIFHDKYAPINHPLVGLSPITACGVAAMEALRIQNTSATFFSNGSRPGGVLMAPGHISQETADRVKEAWDTNFTGENSGKVAVLGDNLKYQQMTVNAHDAQLIEQLNWTAEDVCTAFGVPPYKINVGPPPNYNNIQALDIQYYSQCLQELIEKFEAILDKGLGVAEEKINGRRIGTEFLREDLLQMDTAGRVEAAQKAIIGGLTPNEVRRRYHDAGPVSGGDDPFMQSQNWPIAELAKRDITKQNPVTSDAPVDIPASDTTPQDVPSKSLPSPIEPQLLEWVVQRELTLLLAS